MHEAHDVLEAVEGDLDLRLKATVEGERLVLDFTGSAGRHDGNLNCPLAVTLSACWFAVRVLTDPDIPPCSGAYRPVEVIVPAGCLLNAERGAAVVAGNVETSSRVADLVLAAFGRALGQGTMNNLTLGNDDFTYYETLGGGQGACEDADGPSGVHVAMSNTLNTPVEALERELPLRVTEYALRRGSGGTGRHRGGDGVVRELEALSEMTFSLIGERRRHAPRGAGGGGDGKTGHDTLVSVGGDRRALPAKTTGRLRAGERLRIETPGGGGYGLPSTPPGLNARHKISRSVAMAERIGFLGLGIMGSRMAANVAKAGYELTVWTRTEGKAERWAADAWSTRRKHTGRGRGGERHRREHGGRRGAS